MNDLKRENKRLKEKLVSVSEAKRRSSEEDAQSQSLLQSYKDANAKLFEERQSSQTLQSQLDAMNLNFKKLQAQYLQVKEEHDQLKRIRKEEDNLRRFPLARPDSSDTRRDTVLVSVPRNTADVPKPSSIKPFHSPSNLRNPFSQGSSPPATAGPLLRRGKVDELLKPENAAMPSKELNKKALMTSPSKAPFNLSTKKSIKL